MNSDTYITANRVDSHNKKNIVHEVGRVCAEEACGAVLSRYNPYSFCWQHGIDPKSKAFVMHRSGGRRGAT